MKAFADRLLDWFAVAGRHDLPWQLDATPYRIWVSEIMLQQTQVRTVTPYYLAFVARFPDVATLAGARVDEVLAHWSGLGYYARARNLHRAAGLVVSEHGSELPRDIDALRALPGIGRSTAAAILAQAHGERQAILDGNVKRVLSRHRLIDGWAGRAEVLRALWAAAEAATPATRVAEYTQAIMDLGATVCTRSRPRCDVCPVSEDCAARLAGRERELPTRRPRAPRPARAVTVLVVQTRDGTTLLERRPASGIWGGLLSFPELAADETVADWCRRRLNAEPESAEALDSVAHAFTHFDLTLKPLRLRLDALSRGTIMDDGNWLWYKAPEPLPGGIATPIGRILESVTTSGPTE